jgi:hypothetical protein
MIRRKKKLLQTSLRFELVDGMMRRYRDGREVCLDNKAGRAEYLRRTQEMCDRQQGICSRANHQIVDGTFDHSTNGRGAGGSRQDDRIYDENGNWMNSCSCLRCNGAAGSTRMK